MGGKVSMEEWHAITGSVAAFTSSRAKAELFAGALERRLLVAPVATASDVLASEQFASRDYWEPLVIGGREVRAPGAFAKLSATPLAPLGPVPRLGQHNGTIASRAAAAAPASDAAGVTTRQQPLAGLKVLDLMWVMAGPASTRVLADYGATVVRVESNHHLETARTIQPFWCDEQGTENSALYQNMNAGKLGITIDLAKPEGREVITDLVKWADVVTEAFTPGVMASWGLDYQSVRHLNPSMIMLSTCLMGQTGPVSKFAGYGNLAAALCGFTALVGWPDRPPSGPFSAYSDYVSPRFALATLLAALDHRRRTGEGQYIDFAQAEAAIHFLTPILLDHEVNGLLPERTGNDDPHLAPHGVYPAAGDDRWVAIVCECDAQWEALAGLVGRPELADLPAQARFARRHEIDQVISAWTASQGEWDLQHQLQASGVPGHAVQNSPECHADPQLAALGHFVTTEHAEFGPVELEGSRFFLSATPARVTAAPTIGQHLMVVLEDILGYDADRITDLLVAGALE
jgi:crotonobetainyl-CoA:carnitine CoA-transferase CaiB-like acyl-CoA transferase